MEEAKAYLRTILYRALSEDIGPGDITVQALDLTGRVFKAKVVLRGGGVVCGGFVIEETLSACCRLLGVELVPEVEVVASEGESADRDTMIAVVEGDAGIILASERVMLNLIAMLSGIATFTWSFVKRVDGTGCRIYDTRKTMPLYRCLQKYAVRTGGGMNHRMGLYDQILVKDNHLALARFDVATAVREAVAFRDGSLPGTVVEIEVENQEDVQSALRNGADVVMLDNMTPGEVADAVRLRNDIRPEAQLEVSGGIVLDTVRKYAETGVDRISIGSLTHSFSAADVALDVID